MKRPSDEFKDLLAQQDPQAVPPQQAEPAGPPVTDGAAQDGAQGADSAPAPGSAAAADEVPAFESGLFGDVPHRRHHRRKKKRRMPAAAKAIMTVLCLILVLTVGLGGSFLALRTAGQKDLAADASDVTIGTALTYNGRRYVYNEDVVTFAFLGVDKETFGLEDDRVGTAGQSDTDMLLVLDMASGRATLLSLPRETMVDVNIYSTDGKFVRTQQMQLCLAYAYGDGQHTSCENALTSMRRLLYQIPIEKYFALDLAGIGPINDAIGGVTVESLYDFPAEGVEKGDTVTITGDFAETYVRSRSTDTLDSSLNRLERQQQYLRAFAGQLLPAVMRDFSVLNSLYDTAMRYSTTNISLGDVTYLASVLLARGIDSFETVTLPGEMGALSTGRDGVVNAAFYPDETGLYELVLDLFYTPVG